MTDQSSPPAGNWLTRLLTRFASRSSSAALQAWERDRETLRADFLRLAGASGKPRGLRWGACQWRPVWVLLRDPESGLLTLLTELHVSFEAIPGSDMEDVEAVSQLRQSTAVFHFRQGRWGTAGRVLFNLTPDMAAERMDPTWERVRSSNG